MTETDIQKVIPIQPYIILNTDDLQKKIMKQKGISHFYEFTVEKGTNKHFQAVPDGSVDLLFGIGNDNVQTYISGTVFHVKEWPIEEGKTYFGVRFQPGRCKLPESLVIQDIIDTDLEIDNDCYGQNLADRIAEAEGLEERVRIFYEAYQKVEGQCDRESGTNQLQIYLQNRICQTGGKISIQTLAQETGYSECYIRRVFQRVHGISPKVFEKFVRFQSLLKRMNFEAERIDISEIAVDCGYYDQSHMIKDFRKFSGVTPDQFLKMIRKKGIPLLDES